MNLRTTNPASKEKTEKRTKGENADLEQFVNEDTCLEDHREVEGTPVFEKGEIGQAVVDREPVIAGSYVFSCGCWWSS